MGFNFAQNLIEKIIKKGNLLWLGVLISVILCSLTIEVSFLKNVAEYILFISTCILSK